MKLIYVYLKESHSTDIIGHLLTLKYFCAENVPDF